MQALRVHQFSQSPAAPQWRIDDLPDPEPGPGQVRVKIEAAGVNPVDIYFAAGTYAIRPDLPYIPGMDAAGTLEAVGEGVTMLEPGERVFVAGTTAGKLQGAYATHCLCEERWVRPLSSRLTFAQGAGLNIPYVTAFRALFDVARARRGERVLIHGATGGVGLAALEIARAHGLITITTGGSEEGRDLLKRRGADIVLDHHAQDYLAALDEPPDVVLEMLANVNLQRDIDAIAPRGRIVVIGSRGEATINPRGLMGKQASIGGLTYWTGGEEATARALDAIVEGIEAGDINPVVQQEFDLEAIEQAWQRVMDAPSGGKIVLLP